MKKILSILLIVILLASLTGCKSTTDLKDANKFKKEYESQNGKETKSGKKMRKVSIDKDNPFVYTTAETISKKIDKEETFIVYFGFSTCPWCRSIIEELVRCAKDSDVAKIYYVDISDIRDTREIVDGEIKTTKEGSKGYMELIDKLGEVLDDYKVPVTDSDEDEISLEEKRIYAPNVIAVVNGKAKQLETGISEDLKNPYDKLTDKMKKETYNKFKCLFECLEEEETMCQKNKC